jgi:uncharacterized protein
LRQQAVTRRNLSQGVLRALAFVLALATVWLCLPARAEVAVPPLEARVTDLTGTLGADQRQALESKLTGFEQSKGSQIAVLIVPTTQPETIEEYGIRVAEEWKLGRKGVDDGAILIIAKDDHRMRIEVGYGLEGALNDATGKRIISEIISPPFKQGRFYEGIDAGVDRMIGVVNGEPLPPPPKGRSGSHGGNGNGGNFVVGILFAVFFVGHMLRRLFGALPAALIFGGVAGLIAMSIMGSLIVAVIAGIFSALAAFVLYSAGPSWGGWGGGGFGGSGGGFGGGGFSGGGGGGFGGGGASGGW